MPVEKPEGMKVPYGLKSGGDPHGFIYQIAVGRRVNRGGSGGGLGSGVGYGMGSGAGSGNNSSGALYSPAVPRVVSAGVVNGVAKQLVKPPYPTAARAVRATGAVSVQVTIDEQGKVVAATAVSGHPLLRSAAVVAARASSFVPTLVDGRPIKTTSVIVYNFTDPSIASEVDVKEGVLTPEKALSPEEQAEQERLAEERRRENEAAEKEALRRQAVAVRFHFWVFAVWERLQKNQAAPSENEARFVSGGVATLRIVLAAKTPTALEKLRAAGFTVKSEKEALTLTGSISLDRLEALASIEEVRYVMPDFGF